MNNAIKLPLPADMSPRFSADIAAGLPNMGTASAISPQGFGKASYSQNSGFSSQVGEYSASLESEPSKLFEATAQAKIWTSRIAMHLDRTIRDRLFRQLDVLHNADEWVTGENPLNLESYKTFARAIIFHNIDSKPGLALMPSGNVIAIWQVNSDKLSVEFLPDNKTRWMIQYTTAAGRERTSATTPLERLREVLFPYCADRWFNGS